MYHYSRSGKLGLQRSDVSIAGGWLVAVVDQFIYISTVLAPPLLYIHTYIQEKQVFFF